ncbi:replication-relaxation family protein [Amycolatopsis palatopharyngis]|uniref:replication-relaxation family protein n=1 Tax=Amycolatopsis palatopharyngis TaxID=187982 RepID=UPI0013BEA863|nr:replication-relaxation family protein [Amycolatopsis palatopharyngis]
MQLQPASNGEALARSRGLTERDMSLLSYLDRHRVLTALQVTRLLFGSAHHARHRLTALYQRGVLARFRREVWPGSQPWRYTLGHVGATVHAAATDTPLPKPSAVTEKVLRLAHSPHTEHLLGVNEFFTHLAGHARLHEGCALGQWWPETITADACGGIVRPDGYGEYTDPNGTLGFFYEHDTGTETLHTLTDKITKYAELAQAGIGKPVLFRLPSVARERHLHEAITRRWPGRLPVPVATFAADHPAPNEPATDAVWLPVGQTRRRALTQLPAPLGAPAHRVPRRGAA